MLGSVFLAAVVYGAPDDGGDPGLAPPAVAVAADGSAWVAWADRGGQLFAGRAEGYGPVAGVAVPVTGANQPAIATNGAEGVVAWGESGPRVGWARLDASGAVAGSIATIAGASHPAVAWDGKAWTLTWREATGVGSVVIKSNGKAKAPTHGAAVGEPAVGEPVAHVVDGALRLADGSPFGTPGFAHAAPAGAGGWLAWWQAFDGVAAVAAGPLAAPRDASGWPVGALAGVAPVATGVYEVRQAGVKVEGVRTLAGWKIDGMRFDLQLGLADGETTGWVAAPGGGPPLVLPPWGRVDDPALLAALAARGRPIRSLVLAEGGGAAAGCQVFDDGAVRWTPSEKVGGGSVERVLQGADRAAFLTGVSRVASAAVADTLGAAWSGRPPSAPVTAATLASLCKRAVVPLPLVPPPGTPAFGVAGSCDALADFALDLGPAPPVGTPPVGAPAVPDGWSEPAYALAVRDYLVVLGDDHRLHVITHKAVEVGAAEVSGARSFGGSEGRPSLLAFGDIVVVLSDIPREDLPWNGANPVGALRAEVFDLTDPARPTPRGSLELGGLGHDAFAVGDTLWVLARVDTPIRELARAFGGQGRPPESAERAVGVRTRARAALAGGLGWARVGDAGGKPVWEGSVIPCEAVWARDGVAGEEVGALVRWRPDGASKPHGAGLLGSTLALRGESLTASAREEARDAEERWFVATTPIGLAPGDPVGSDPEPPAAEPETAGKQVWVAEKGEKAITLRYLSRKMVAPAFQLEPFRLAACGGQPYRLCKLGTTSLELRGETLVLTADRGVFLVDTEAREAVWAVWPSPGAEGK